MDYRTFDSYSAQVLSGASGSFHSDYAAKLADLKLVVGIDDDDLGGLSRAVHSGDQCPHAHLRWNPTARLVPSERP